MVAFNVEYGHEILFLLHDHGLEVGKLLVGCGFAAIDVIAAHQYAGFARFVDIGFVVAVAD